MGVRVLPEGVDFTAGSPAAASMFEMYLWTTGTDTPSSFAAADMLPVRETASSASS